MAAFFPGGGELIRATVPDDVQMGKARSCSLTGAASQGQDIKLFWTSAAVAA